MKITFELSTKAAKIAAINAGCHDKDLDIWSIGIQRHSRITIDVKDGNKYQTLMAQQNAGYLVIDIE